MKAWFATFLVFFGLCAGFTMGMNEMFRWSDRSKCEQISPLAEFVEYNHWAWTCRIQLVDGTYADVR